MRKIVVLAVATATAAGSAAVLVRRHRNQRLENLGRALQELNQRVVGNTALQRTTVQERCALVRASLHLHRTALQTENIVGLARVCVQEPTLVDIDAFMRFMSVAILIAREYEGEDFDERNEPDPDQLQHLYELIGSDPRFLAICVHAAATLTQLPIPLDIPGDTLATLDALMPRFAVSTH